MVDIGRDGTITVQKLEGSEIRFRAKSSQFMASKLLALNVMKLTTASYGGITGLKHSGLTGPF
jgi:hypothetical protein